MSNEPEIKVGDRFIPIPGYRWYKGEALKIVSIENPENPEEVRCFRTRSDKGVLDRFWRYELLDSFDRLTRAEAVRKLISEKWDGGETFRYWQKTRRIGDVTYLPEDNVLAIHLMELDTVMKFDLGACRTPEHFTSWFWHMYGKEWMTPEMHMDLYSSMFFAIMERTGKVPQEFFGVRLVPR
jgi:hypothetical protein